MAMIGKDGKILNAEVRTGQAGNDSGADLEFLAKQMQSFAVEGSSLYRSEEESRKHSAARAKNSSKPLPAVFKEALQKARSKSVGPDALGNSTSGEQHRDLHGKIAGLIDGLVRDSSRPAAAHGRASLIHRHLATLFNKHPDASIKKQHLDNAKAHLGTQKYVGPD